MISAELVHVIESSVPKLEGALHDIFPSLEARMQLRETRCGLATGALQRHLDSEYGIHTDRKIADLTDTPRGLNFRIVQHVVLFDPDTGHTIDPTYGQFFGLVGLTPQRAAQDARLASLYPAPKVAVFPTDASEAFGTEMADRATEIRDEIRTLPSYDGYILPQATLLGAPKGEIASAFRSIWSPERYRPLSVDEQASRDSGFRSIIDRMCRHMISI